MTGLWIAVAAVTIITLALVMAPLLRRRVEPPERAEFDLAVYRDQLAEVDRDHDRGLLDDGQADAVRLEVKRRMLAAIDSGTRRASRQSSGRTGRVLAGLLVIAIPLAAVGGYLALGRPDALTLMAVLPSRPATEPMAPSPGGMSPDMDQALTRLEERLRDDPDNVEGWMLLGRSYLAIGRPADAVKALSKAFHLTDGEPEIAAAYGEALVAAADGVITEESRKLFDMALQRDPANMQARYYLALDRAQQGDLQGALRGWVDLLAMSPADAPWRDLVQRQATRAAAELGVDLSSVEPSPGVAGVTPSTDAPTAEAPGPGAADMEAAAEMSEQERNEMIRSMVDRLAAKLHDNPDDREGWLRLARSYEVLGETEKAREARDRAAALGNGRGGTRSGSPSSTAP